MKINRGNFQSNWYFLNHYKLLSKEDKILELGSGTGNMVYQLKKKGFKVSGTETNPEHVRFAKEHFKVSLTKLSSEKLPYKAKSFDKVLSFDVFEHIPNTDKHLKEVSRILKDGGEYIFSTPNKILDVPFEIYSLRSFTKYKIYHCSLHSYGELKAVLAKNGFSCEFYKVPIKTKFLIDKIKKNFGEKTARLFSILPIDDLPNSMKTNFYVVARKR